MRRVLLLAVAVAALVPFVVQTQAPAARRHTAQPVADRFAPSGVYSVDPNLPASVLAGRSGKAVSPLSPSVNTGGCADASGGAVRANQECTNQSRILGRSQ